MHLLPADEHHLYRALALAREAAAFASPNPAVGCVLVQDGRTIGQGAHRYELRDHAEIAALKDAAGAGETVRGATAFVTLEPCSHHGRTGPCAEALVDAGISRCVVATVDPNPLVRGGGLARLRAGGVNVDVADSAEVVAQSARRLIDAFAFSIQRGRSFVTLKSAVSSDGQLAPSPTSRSASAPYWITGPAAREEVQELRHASDVLLCGVGTVLADDPALSDRTGLPRRRRLLRLIADSGLRTPLDSRLVREAEGDLLFLAGENAPAERAEALRQAGAEVIRLPLVDGRLDPRQALELLAARQVRSVLLEAGSAMNGSLLRAGLVDRVVLYRGPALLGAGAVAFADGGPTPETLLRELTSLSERRVPGEVGQDLCFAGYLHDPWAGF